MSDEYNYDFGGQYTSGGTSEPKQKKTGKGKKIIGIVAVIVASIFMIIGVGTVVGQITGMDFTNHAGLVNKNPEESPNENEGSLSQDGEEEVNQESEKQEPHYTLSKADQIEATDIVQATVLDVSEVVEEVMPSVVAIKLTLEYSYGYQVGQSSGSGTGVILAQDENEILVVTNAHVVNEEESTSFYYSVDTVGIDVTFVDNTTAKAYVKGVDKEADLAVIAVKLEDISQETQSSIKVASIGDSTALKMGNGVIAIGNALGYGQSVTVGYVSALNREVKFSDGYTRNLLQIDAAINPGNSGGGLFDVYGRLIGINESKTVSEEVEGIGFAIPISEVEEIITELMNTIPRTQYSEEERGYLGVSSVTVPSNYVASGYPEGAVIFAIMEGSPAESANLQLQDIVIGVNDMDINSATELVEELAYYKPGDTVVLHIKRIERNRFVDVEVSVTLGDRSIVETEEQETQSQAIVIPGFGQ